MGFLVRTILIWLLVVAVPAQGAVAATMAFCGPNHHGGGTSAQAQATAPAHHAHHDASSAPDHEHPQVAPLTDDVASFAATAATSGKSSHSAQHKCSACASCCSLGAILSSVLAVPAPVFGPTVFSAVVPSVDAFAAEGPDRPPRHVLA